MCGVRTLIAAILAVLFTQTQPPALRIVVIEGEGAVNIIQQKTAVRPLVEVRDRNNVPVSGATVTFTIAGGKSAAFAGGAQTLTLTTNAAGQAAAGGFSAMAPGAVQIQVQAAFQGQLATAAITQTNFATAAAAAQAGAAGGAAAGGGGGISGMTIGIVGAAVAGGAVAATQLSDSGDGNSGKTYTGQFSGQMTVTTNVVLSGTCISTRSVSGTVSITVGSDGRQSANLDLRAPQTATGGSPLTCPPSLNPTMGGNPPATNYSFTLTNGPGTDATKLLQTASFNGSLSGDVINGTLTYTEEWSGNFPNQPQSVVSGGGTINMTLSLR